MKCPKCEALCEQKSAKNIVRDGLTLREYTNPYKEYFLCEHCRGHSAYLIMENEGKFFEFDGKKQKWVLFIGFKVRKEKVMFT